MFQSLNGCIQSTSFVNSDSIHWLFDSRWQPSSCESGCTWDINLPRASVPNESLILKVPDVLVGFCLMPLSKTGKGMSLCLQQWPHSLPGWLHMEPLPESRMPPKLIENDCSWLTSMDLPGGHDGAGSIFANQLAGGDIPASASVGWWSYVCGVWKC